MSGPSAFEIALPYLPPAAVVHVRELCGLWPVDLRIARPRRSKLGDHRAPSGPHPRHRISINADLNPWAFLTTLLHEFAHAATWEQHRRRRLRPHGAEWRREFSAILGPVVSAGTLPADVAAALRGTLARPAAATCSDRALLLALARYDDRDDSRVRVENLRPGTLFRLDDGRVLRAGPLVRTRRRCFERRSGREYRVHGLLLVEPLADERRGLAPTAGY